MKEQLISFETAKLAKEKGFDQNPYKANKCYAPEYADGSNIRLCNTLFYQDVNIAVAPTQSLLQKWLREEHNIHVYVTYRRFVAKPDSDDGFYFHIGKSIEFSLCDDWGGRYKTYEEALEVGLQKALSFIS